MFIIHFTFTITQFLTDIHTFFFHICLFKWYIFAEWCDFLCLLPWVYACPSHLDPLLLCSCSCFPCCHTQNWTCWCSLYHVVSVSLSVCSDILLNHYLSFHLLFFLFFCLLGLTKLLFNFVLLWHQLINFSLCKLSFNHWSLFSLILTLLL